MKPKFNIQKKGEQKMANVIILAHFKDRDDITDIIPICTCSGMYYKGMSDFMESLKEASTLKDVCCLLSSKTKSVPTEFEKVLYDTPDAENNVKYFILTIPELS